MFQWPHSGFHVHAGVGVPEEDRAFALRLARYCARNPIALERMTYDADASQVTYRSDKADGPTAGLATVDPLDFLARLVTHIPDPGQVMQRYYGWYASRTRYRWAELLRRTFEVDPLACPRCQGRMRIVAVITDPVVITRILAHRARVRDSPHRPRPPPPRRRRAPTPTVAGSPHP